MCMLQMSSEKTLQAVSKPNEISRFAALDLRSPSIVFGQPTPHAWEPRLLKYSAERAREGHGARMVACGWVPASPPAWARALH